MVLNQISLQHFRSYPKAQFSFDPRLTIIVGQNASGKTNLVEAISLLSTGKSFRTSKEGQLIAFGETVARVTGEVLPVIPSEEGIQKQMTGSPIEVGDDKDAEKIEIVLSDLFGQKFQKKYLINGVSKRRSALAGILPTVLFTPLDLVLVSGQPGDKRRFLDEVLEQTDQQYASALLLYGKALRQRNALLEVVQETGRRDDERFAYWDNVLIANGGIVTTRREALITYINQQEKKLFPFTLTYDKSIMSRERLLQYKEAEVGSGMTLVGPQRDDIVIQSKHPMSKELEDVKYFCSRGQQRLVTLELKQAQLSYMQEHLQVQPLLVLDDIFSELDSGNITYVLSLAHGFQTIITTTHKEFLDTTLKDKKAMIELGNGSL